MTYHLIVTYQDDKNRSFSTKQTCTLLSWPKRLNPYRCKWTNKIFVNRKLHISILKTYIYIILYTKHLWSFKSYTKIVNKSIKSYKLYEVFNIKGSSIIIISIKRYRINFYGIHGWQPDELFSIKLSPNQTFNY